MTRTPHLIIQVPVDCLTCRQQQDGGGRVHAAHQGQKGHPQGVADHAPQLVDVGHVDHAGSCALGLMEHLQDSQFHQWRSALRAMMGRNYGRTWTFSNTLSC